MKTKKKKDAMRSKTKTVGYGWVSKWKEGTLGWFLPAHLCGYNGSNEIFNGHECQKGEMAYLCRIEVKQVFDSKGREIVRVVK